MVEYFELVIRRNGKKEVKTKSTNLYDITQSFETFAFKNSAPLKKPKPMKVKTDG